MNKARRNSILVAGLILALVAWFAPIVSSAATPLFVNITTCNQLSGSPLPSSVGTYGPSQSVYVPVSDATVELNTGTLVYEDCVLRELVDAERVAEIAYMANNETNQILTGRTTPTGQQAAQFVQQQSGETLAVANNSVTNSVQNSLNSLDPVIKAQVQQAIAQAYATGVNNAQSMLACPYTGATTDFTSANLQGSIWNDILATASPCNPLFAYVDADDIVMTTASQEVNCLQNEWLWGGGFYAVTQGSGGPCEQTIVTPSSNVNSLYTQVLQSPLNQLQNANDIGQLITPAFAGIASQILANTGGVSGLESPTNSSSLSQIAAQLDSQNTALGINDTLEYDIAEVGQRIASDQQILNAYTNASSTLYQDQNSCWSTVIQAVCGTANPAGNTCTPEVPQCTTNPYTGAQSCTTSPGSPVTVATSTYDFAGAAINSSSFYGGESFNTAYANTVTDLSNAEQLQAEIQSVENGLQTNSASALSTYSTLPSPSTLAQGASTAASNASGIVNQLSPQSGGVSFIQNAYNGWQGQTNQTDSSGNPVVTSWTGFSSSYTKPSGTSLDNGWCNATSGTVSAWETVWR